MKHLKSLLVILLVISLFGCTSNKEPIGGEDPVEPVLQTEITDISQVDFDIFQKLYSEDKNVIYSPLSLKIALIMAANGADGETLKEFEKLFGCSLEELNDQMKEVTKSLENAGYGTTLSLANSIWVSDRFEVFDSYLNTLVNNFDAEVFNKDLTTNETLKELNKWVNDKTNGLIKTIKDENFTEDYLAVLINALYLKAKWAYVFEDTFKSIFHAKDGDVEVDMMALQATLDYLENEKHQGVILPYSDSKTVMIAIKGEDLKNFNSEDLAALLETKSECEVSVKLPKFEDEGKYDLVDILKSCGLNKAFDKDNANFKKMGSVLPDENIYISEIIQKAKIKVDQNGTEAAAVTMIGMAKCTSIGGQKEIKSIIFDEPFIYLIMDIETNSILFVGVNNNPKM